MGVQLNYVVPEEGSNVWFDGWVIPVYAKNPKAATYFIDYMCKPENAIYNMEEIGYVSVIATPEIFEWASDEEAWPEAVNASYMFGAIGKNAHINPVQYPDLAIINKCALMHDAGDQTEALVEMWNRVKGDNLSAGMMIFLILVVICALGYGFYIVKKNNSHKSSKKRR